MRLAVTILLFAGCATSERIEITPDVQSSKADGLPSKLHLVDDHHVHVDEPSDLVIKNGKLYVVSDRHSRIYEIDDDGDVRGSLDVEGEDLEALALDHAGAFYIGDESRAKVWRLTPSGERDKEFAIDTTDDNSGIEGLAFDPDGNMLVAKEKSPAMIIRLDAEGTEIDRTQLGYADDLSALTWNEQDDHLYALSAEEKKLFRLDADFDRITSWKLPIESAEGLAFTGDTLYIVSDGEQRLYELELE